MALRGKVGTPISNRNHNSLKKVISEQLVTYTELVLKWAQIVALIVAAIWALHQYNLHGADDWMVNLEIDTEVLPYEGDMKLLFVKIKSINPTDAKFVINEKSHGSFMLYVYEIPDGRANGSVIDFSDKENKEKLITKNNLISKEGYVFLPHAVFNDSVAIPLTGGKTYSLRAEWNQDDKDGKPDLVSINKVVKL